MVKMNYHFLKAHLRCLLFFTMALLTILLVPTIKGSASDFQGFDPNTMINVNDYHIWGHDTLDDTVAIQEVLNLASSKGRSLYFPSGTYIISEDIYLRSNVNIYGNPMHSPIFRGVHDTEVIMLYDYDALNQGSILIESIFFDNFFIHSVGDNNNDLSVLNSLFINGKLVNLTKVPAMAPDQNNMNGGERTAYYILKSRGTLIVENNVFLRDENSKGRGVGTFRTIDTLIQSNYWGMIEDYETFEDLISESVSDILERLSLYESEERITVNDDQGFFMTAINNLNYDQNVTISHNIINLNNDIEEVHYNDQSGNTLGYNRDHLIYARGYQGLYVYQNYFSGQPNNPDGGVKIRNGIDLTVFDNYFNDVPLLLYIQNDHNAPYIFDNVFISENIFDIKTLQGQWGTGISGRFYQVDSVKNVTIMNNKILSNQERKDFIKFDFDFNITEIENLHVYQNAYLEDKTLIEVHLVKRHNAANFIERTNIISENPYISEHEAVNETVKLSNRPIRDVDFTIENQMIVSDAAYMWVDGTVYNHEQLNAGIYQIILQKSVYDMVIVEGEETLIKTYIKTWVTIEIFLFDEPVKISGIIHINDFKNQVGLNDAQVNLRSLNSDMLSIEDDYLRVYQTGVLFVQMIYQNNVYIIEVKTEVVVPELASHIFYLNEPKKLEFSENVLIDSMASQSSNITITSNLHVLGTQIGVALIEVVFDSGTIATYEIRIKPSKTIFIDDLDNYYYLEDVVHIELSIIDSNTTYAVSSSENINDSSLPQITFNMIGKAYITVYDIDDETDYVYAEMDVYKKPTQIFFSSSTIDLSVGENYELTPLFDNDSYDEVIFYISSTGYIDFDQVHITAKKPGTILITAVGMKTGLSTVLRVNISSREKPFNNHMALILTVASSLIVGGIGIGIYKKRKNT